jgi:hypothetical protein
MRPTGLAPLTAIMCVLNLTGFLFVEESGVRAAVVLPVFAFVILFSYVVLWYFWKGRNWARWLVLLTSGVALLNLALLTMAPLVQSVIIVAEAAVAAFLLYWLNTPAVRAFFIPKSNDGAA